MVREKRDHRDDDVIESGQSESVPQDTGGGEQENSASGGETAEASSEPSPQADRAGDSTEDEGQLDWPITEPVSPAEASSVDDPGQTPAGLDGPVEIPPPVSPAANVSDSSIASLAEPAGISFGGFSPDAPTADGEPAMHDLVDRDPGSVSTDFQQPFLRHSDPGGVSTVPPSGGGGDAPVDSELGSPSTRQMPPLFVETGRGEQTVRKRLEIEVEVTVTNQERIAQIMTNRTMRTFSELAAGSIHQVAQDLRTFRESYRSVWGRRY